MCHINVLVASDFRYKNSCFSFVQAEPQMQYCRLSHCYNLYYPKFSLKPIRVHYVTSLFTVLEYDWTRLEARWYNSRFKISLAVRALWPFLFENFPTAPHIYHVTLSENLSGVSVYKLSCCFILQLICWALVSDIFSINCSRLLCISFFVWFIQTTLLPSQSVSNQMAELHSLVFNLQMHIFYWQSQSIAKYSF